MTTSKGPFPNRAPRRMWVASGFRCAIVDAPLYGAINGYVLVPGITSEQAAQVDVHGGVTYEGYDGWIGFDAMHAFDVWPDMPLDSRPRIGVTRHWTEDMVIAETERMAADAKRVIEQ